MGVVEMAHRDNCYCCPYGGLHAVPAVFCGVAMLATWVYTVDCNFFRASISENSTEKIGVGFFSVEEESSNDECVDYPNELDADAPLQFGRLMAVLASVIGFISFVLTLIPSCWNAGQMPYMKTLAGTFFCLSVMALFSLVALRSDICQNSSECELGGSGGICITSSIVWVLAGCTTLLLKPRRRASVDDAAFEMPSVSVVPAIRETITITKNLDGSTTTTTQVTQVNPDGTQSTRTMENTEVNPELSIT